MYVCVPEVVIAFVLIVVVPLTDKFLLVPDKLIVSAVPSPNTALPVIVNEYAPLSAEFVVTVPLLEVKVLSAFIVMPPAAV